MISVNCELLPDCANAVDVKIVLFISSCEAFVVVSVSSLSDESSAVVSDSEDSSSCSLLVGFDVVFAVGALSSVTANVI